MPRKGLGLPRVAADLAGDVELALQGAAVVLHTAVLGKYSTPGLGRVYGTHRASKPGDPPAPDTGALRGSVGISRTDTGWRIGTSLEYAPYLEFGTPTLAPRPAWRPAIDETKDRMGPAIVATLDRSEA